MTQPKFIKSINRYNSLEILIGVTVLFFVISQILIAFGWFSLTWVALAYLFSAFLESFWTILTYGFFHQGFLALFFNMLLLFYFGSIFLDFDKRSLLKYIYLGGIITGGLFFMLSYYLFPDMFVVKSPLLGASAGVMAVMTYTSILMPHYQIKIRFLGFFKLIHILIFFIVFNLLQIPLGNPGGYFAHLGGLTFGFLFFMFRNFQRKKVVKKPIFTIPKQKKVNTIDAILDKISNSGYNSLTQKEKEELFKQSKKN